MVSISNILAFYDFVYMHRVEIYTCSLSWQWENGGAHFGGKNESNLDEELMAIGGA